MLYGNTLLVSLNKNKYKNNLYIQIFVNVIDNIVTLLLSLFNYDSVLFC